MAPRLRPFLTAPLLLTLCIGMAAGVPDDDAPAEADRIVTLVRDLDADEAEVRERASEELRGLGEAARPALEDAIRSKSRQVAGSASALLRLLDQDAQARTGADLVWAGLRGGPGRSGVVGSALPTKKPVEVWSVEVPVSELMEGAVVPAGDRIFCLEPEGVVRSYRASDGAPLWLAQLDGRIAASAVLAAGRLVVPTRGGVTALDADSGRAAWTVENPYGSDAAPAIDGGRVYASFRNLGIRALDVRTGETVFEKKLAPAGALLVDRGLVVTGTEDGELLRVDPESGKVHWKTDLGSPPLMGPTLAAPGVIVVFASDRLLRGVDSDTGKVSWTRKHHARSHSESLAAAGNRVYVTDRDGYLYAYHADSGRLAWRRDTGMIRMGSPCVTDRLVVTGDRGWLKARDAVTGDEVWRLNCVERSNATPSAWNGRLFVLFGGVLRAYE